MSRSELITLRRSYSIADNCFRYVGISGVFAAGSLAANDVIAAFDLSSGTRAWLERLRVKITTITAFTTPIVAGRALKLSALTAMPTPGGVTCSRVTKSNGASVSSSGMLIGSTGPLAGVTALNQAPIAIIPLIAAGTAGAVTEYELTFGLTAANCGMPPFLGLSALATLDAAGTLQIEAEADYEVELPTGF